MPGSLSDYAEAQLLNQLFGGVPYAIPNILYFGYMVGVPGETGPGAEPNSGNYQRVAVTNNTTNFPVTANQIKTNAIEIQFESATSNHGLVQAVGIWDSPTSGNMLVYFPLANPISIGVSDAMRIPAASLTLQFNTGGLSNYVKNALLNTLLGNVPFNIIPILYFGYATSTPTDAVAGTEPSAGAYARVGVANNTNLFPAATLGSKANALDINFPEATASQGTVTNVQIFDAQSGGNYLGRYAFGTPQSITTGTIPSIPANTFTITLD
ncbi:phage tail fiber protein [Iningainema tapete]|uniref:Uncharacterized protein n=1 Tax=Iningainema tapete BLCC-T55 TaxID=2748662 RepID=A0A8J6XAW4_9CYAN|nr:hypothetical protein [Iningainema tapete]MBD2771144.1 hypothetical protein [Iningainema tapete BLCC-T55]